MKDQHRLERIKDRLLQENAIAVDLEGKFSQARLKEQARCLKQQIMEIEVTFLSDENLNRYRPPDAENAFFASIEETVDLMVTQARLRLESTLEKYGPDATHIDG